jgi:hypothetical protein
MRDELGAAANELHAVALLDETLFVVGPERSVQLEANG